MKFKTKPVEIEAWREECGEEMPEILVAASIRGELSLPQVAAYSMKGVRYGKGYVWNGAHKSRIEFNHGDWLIYSNGPDDIYPCTDEVFQKKYERV